MNVVCKSRGETSMKKVAIVVGGTTIEDSVLDALGGTGYKEIVLIPLEGEVTESVTKLLHSAKEGSPDAFIVVNNIGVLASSVDKRIYEYYKVMDLIESEFSICNVARLFVGEGNSVVDFNFVGADGLGDDAKDEFVSRTDSKLLEEALDD